MSCRYVRRKNFIRFKQSALNIGKKNSNLGKYNQTWRQSFPNYTICGFYPHYVSLSTMNQIIYFFDGISILHLAGALSEYFLGGIALLRVKKNTNLIKYLTEQENIPLRHQLN